MRVGADHETSGEGIVFQQDLVDNASSWFPEADTVFVGNRSQKVKDFFVFVQGIAQIGSCAILGLDQVIAVDGAGDRHRWTSGLHKLQKGHLRGRVLHRDPIRGKVNIIDASSQVGRVGGRCIPGRVRCIPCGRCSFGSVGVPKVGEKYFFGQGQRTSALFPYRLASGFPFSVMVAQHLGVKSHGRNSKGGSKYKMDCLRWIGSLKNTDKASRGLYCSPFPSKKPFSWVPALKAVLSLAGSKT